MPRLITECVADIPPRETQWLWPGRIPLETTSLLVGEPGVGKSSLALQIAAIVSGGGYWPDRLGPPCEPGTVLILQAEDPQDATTRRLAAANAELSHIHFPDIATASSPDEFMAGMDREIEKFRDARGGVKLVIIDPVVSYLRSVDSPCEYPELLRLLPGFAERNGIALLLTAHLNKGESNGEIQRIAGPPGLASMPRLIWGVSRDPSDRSRRVLSLVKHSLTARAGGNLTYGYRDRRYDWGETPVKSRGVLCEDCGRPIAFLHFDRQLVAVEAEAVVSGQGVRVDRHDCRAAQTTSPSPERSKRSKRIITPGRRGPRPLKLAIAMDWCYDQLQQGPIAQADLIRLARGRGIKRATLANAIKALEASRTLDEAGKLIVSIATETPAPSVEPRPVAGAAREHKVRFERRKEKILVALGEAFPAGLSLTEIRRQVLGNRVSTDQLRTVLTVLRDSGQVRSHAAESGGRYRSVWTLTDKPSGTAK